MENNNLFMNAEVIGNIVGAVLSFLLGLVAAFLVQFLLEKRRKVQITYSIKTEVPWTLAKEELKDKLRIEYLGTEVKNLYSYSLRIANTGKVTIRNQTFTCLFKDGTRSIDQLFPRILTIPPREVGPIEKDVSVSIDNEYRYSIGVLGVGQIVNIDFLNVVDESPDVEVIFRSNTEQEVDFVEGEISGAPTLEAYLQNVAVNLFLFFLVIQVLSFLPFIGKSFGVIFGLPLLLNAYRSLPPIISAIASLLQDARKRSQSVYDQQRQIVESQWNVAGNVNLLAQDRVALIENLQKLQIEIHNLTANNSVDEETGIDISYLLTKIIREVQKPVYNKISVLDYLGRAKALLATDTITEANLTSSLEKLIKTVEA